MVRQYHRQGVRVSTSYGQPSQTSRAPMSARLQPTCSASQAGGQAPPAQRNHTGHGCCTAIGSGRGKAWTLRQRSPRMWLAALAPRPVDFRAGAGKAPTCWRQRRRVMRRAVAGCWQSQATRERAWRWSSEKELRKVNQTGAQQPCWRPSPAIRFSGFQEAEIHPGRAQTWGSLTTRNETMA
jgi:hypothetical protein